MEECKKIQNSEHEIGNYSYLNKRCWLVKNLNYSPYKRCQYCEFKFRNCLFLQYQIISLLFFSLSLFLSLLLFEKTISILMIVAVCVLISVYGYFFNTSTEKIIKTNFFLKKTKNDLKNLSDNLEDKVKEQTQGIKELADNLKFANKKLESANKELKRLDEAKSEFLSIASHQLRTPLTAMKGLSSMLLDGDYGKINKKPKEAVSQIFESSERMNKLVENLLNISRIESGRLKFSFEYLDFRELVKETVEELKIVAAENRLEINLKQPKSKINLRIDKQKIRQVIINFIDNSIKYSDVSAAERRGPSLGRGDCGGGKYSDAAAAFTSTDETGQYAYGKPRPDPPLKGEGESAAIVVKTEIVTGDKLKEILKTTCQYGNVDLKIKGNDKFAVFSVKDNGRGISKDDQCRLFQKFTRGNGVSTMHTEGTGLGLYVCRKMVEAHKGYVWVESEGEGKGSKFAFAVAAG